MRDDEYTLLCERCGYVLEGLSREGACPECGKPVAESVPERRTDEPAMWRCVGHPLQSLDWMRIDTLRVSRRRAYRRCVAASVIAGTAIIVGWMPWWMTGRGPVYALLATVGSALLVVAAAPIAGVVLWMLSALEAAGLRFIGRRHGYRMTRRISATVCSHGCVGWIAGASLWGLGWLIVGIGGLFPDAPLGQTLVPAGLLVGTTGALAGFLFFETFAWLGLRRCRFANRAREDGPGETRSAADGPGAGEG